MRRSLPGRMRGSRVGRVFPTGWSSGCCARAVSAPSSTTRASNVLDVGRSHRLVTDRQYRALLARQHGHCAHPGCPNTKRLHAHHRIHWIHGGRTDLGNLLLLCERHHVAHHAGEFEILPDRRGQVPVRRPPTAATSAHPPTPANPDTRPLEDEHADLAADAATPRWDGQRLDRHYAISVLAQRRQVAS